MTECRCTSDQERMRARIADLERERDEARRELRALEWLVHPEGPDPAPSYTAAATALGWKDDDG